MLIAEPGDNRPPRAEDEAAVSGVLQDAPPSPLSKVAVPPFSHGCLPRVLGKFPTQTAGNEIRAAWMPVGGGGGIL